MSRALTKVQENAEFPYGTELSVIQRHCTDVCCVRRSSSAGLQEIKGKDAENPTTRWKMLTSLWTDGQFQGAGKKEMEEKKETSILFPRTLINSWPV